LMLVCAYLLVLTEPALANDYYVSASGNDSNDGSQGHPWATVQNADKKFVLGATGTVIHVASGSYGSATQTLSRGGSSPTVRLAIQCDAGVASATAAMGKCMFRGAFEIFTNNVDLVGFDIGNNPDLAIAING